MATVIEQFVAQLGWDIDSSEFKQFQAQIKEVGEDLIRVTKWITGGTAALLGLTTATNNATAEQERLAESVGASASVMDALAQAAGGLGLNYENVIDLVEEMNNKLGEMSGLGEMTAVQESLRIIKLDFKDIKDLRPEEQFQQIIDAALKLGDASQAVSAVDMLMGGEANKILGFLRTQNMTLGELIQKYQRLNFLTDKGRRGARDYSDAWRTLLLALGSQWREFSGLLGENLAPYLKVLTSWIADNKELLGQKIAEWAKAAAYFIKELGLWVLRLAVGIKRVASYLPDIKTLAYIFAGWEVGKLVAGFASLASSFSVLGKSSGGIAEALGALGKKAPLLGGLFGVIALSVKSIKDELEGKEGYFHSWGEDLADVLTEIDNINATMMGLSLDEYRQQMLSSFEYFKVLMGNTKTFLLIALKDMGRQISDFFETWVIGSLKRVVDYTRNLGKNWFVGPSGPLKHGTLNTAPKLQPSVSNTVINNNYNQRYNMNPTNNFNTPGGQQGTIQMERMTIRAVERALSDAAKSIDSGVR